LKELERVQKNREEYEGLGESLKDLKRIQKTGKNYKDWEGFKDLGRIWWTWKEFESFGKKTRVEEANVDMRLIRIYSTICNVTSMWVDRSKKNHHVKSNQHNGYLILHSNFPAATTAAAAAAVYFIFLREHW
jgi:hypothetical protein